MLGLSAPRPPQGRGPERSPAGPRVAMATAESLCCSLPLRVTKMKAFREIFVKADLANCILTTSEIE